MYKASKFFKYIHFSGIFAKVMDTLLIRGQLVLLFLINCYCALSTVTSKTEIKPVVLFIFLESAHFKGLHLKISLYTSATNISFQFIIIILSIKLVWIDFFCLNTTSICRLHFLTVFNIFDIYEPLQSWILKLFFVQFWCKSQHSLKYLLLFEHKMVALLISGRRTFLAPFFTSVLYARMLKIIIYAKENNGYVNSMKNRRFPYMFSHFLSWRFHVSLVQISERYDL